MKFKSPIHILFILGLSLLFFGLSTTYAQEVCRKHSTNTEVNGTHIYTCQNNADYPDKILCEAGFENDWPNFSCPSGLRCHICKKSDSTPVTPVAPIVGESCAEVACAAPAICSPEEICVEPTPSTGALQTCTDAITTNCTPPGSTTPTATQGSTTTATTTGCKIKGEKPYIVNGKDVCICVPTPKICCGVKLNTSVPFIGKCITTLSQEKWNLVKNDIIYDPDTLIIHGDEAFPRLMLGLTKILVTVILLASFGGIVVAGVMMASAGGDDGQVDKGKQLIGSIIVGLALLGASGVILRIINPNFFG